MCTHAACSFQLSQLCLNNIQDFNAVNCSIGFHRFAYLAQYPSGEPPKAKKELSPRSGAAAAKSKANADDDTQIPAASPDEPGISIISSDITRHHVVLFLTSVHQQKLSSHVNSSTSIMRVFFFGYPLSRQTYRCHHFHP
jgi:hypothetical protein